MSANLKWAFGVVAAACVAWTTIAVCAMPPDESATGGTTGSRAEDTELQRPANVAEARGRARLLHETLHGVLQVVHRDFYREDEGLTLPSLSLEDVFAELEATWNVKIRWLAVNAKAMSIEHEPRDAFEKEAAKALAAGKQEFDRVEGNEYRHVGTIRLSSQCLKCHLPKRTSTEDRAAGLVISMPFNQE